jgi:hypothetical protein
MILDQKDNGHLLTTLFTKLLTYHSQHGQNGAHSEWVSISVGYF